MPEGVLAKEKRILMLYLASYFGVCWAGSNLHLEVKQELLIKHVSVYEDAQ